MTLSAIAAMAKNRVIGSEGKLPWHLPEDLKFFKQKTKGHIILMGRKTFESLDKPLPNRLHVVITRQPGYQAEGAHVFSNINEALEYCQTQVDQWGDEVFIVGGGEIYKQMLAVTDRIYLTVIDRDFEGDASFPEFDESEFEITECVEYSEPMPFSIRTYDRKVMLA